MDYAIWVQILQTFQYLFSVYSNDVLVERAELFDHLRQWASSHALEEDVDLVIHSLHAIIGDDVLVF